MTHVKRLGVGAVLIGTIMLAGQVEWIEALLVATIMAYVLGWLALNVRYGENGDKTRAIKKTTEQK